MPAAAKKLLKAAMTTKVVTKVSKAATKVNKAVIKVGKAAIKVNKAVVKVIKVVMLVLLHLLAMRRLLNVLPLTVMEGY